MDLFGTAVEKLGLTGAMIIFIFYAGRAVFSLVKGQLETITNKHFEQTDMLIKSFEESMEETRVEFRREIQETRKEHKEDRISFQTAVNDLKGEIQGVKQEISEIKK